MLVQPIGAIVISRLRDGDADAFRLIYENQSQKIYAFVYKFLKNKEGSEEIVQETFLQLWLKKETLEDQYPINALLYTIARRLTLNALRKSVNQHAAFRDFSRDLNDIHNDTEERIMLDDLRRVTDEILSKLPKQQQMVFRLSRLEGLSHDEIGERMHISRNTVKNHLVQALKNLRGHFDKNHILYIIAIHTLLKP
ncbi:RNA polymerase sigma-70 factor [Mucilaginibacter sp. cycad4]|uniref:RNA polymerase sigma factor n=1 Tax=Mucilaginibacter sp. cycad4 TaxID=3342096 RepID=UPI002AAB0E0C|nr:RNA polymerase sigma-70 factor [Mucilaginibacter gossypii]WPV01940.1 RNA polymerase sigma-70 factor [Mucilaginibacter gossypii]